MNFLLPLLVGISTPAEASEQSDCIAAYSVSAVVQGYTLAYSDNDTLVKSQKIHYPFTLQAGRSYIVLACGDSQSKDLDIQIYDQNRNLVAKDAASDKRPVAEIIPVWTGPFIVDVEMYDSYGLAGYALAVFIK